MLFRQAKNVSTLEEKSCPVKVWGDKVKDMTLMGWLGSKTSTQLVKIPPPHHRGRVIWFYVGCPCVCPSVLCLCIDNFGTYQWIFTNFVSFWQSFLPTTGQWWVLSFYIFIFLCFRRWIWNTKFHTYFPTSSFQCWNWAVVSQRGEPVVTKETKNEKQTVICFTTGFWRSGSHWQRWVRIRFAGIRRIQIRDSRKWRVKRETTWNRWCKKTMWSWTGECEVSFTRYTFEMGENS